MLNEQFQPINEDLKFEALSQLRELQSNLVGISFLSVIAIMRPENPLKKDVLAFQDDLDELTIKIQNFISKAKNDISFEEENPESDEEEKTTEPDEADSKEDTDDAEGTDGTEETKKVEDSSEPEEKGDK